MVTKIQTPDSIVKFLKSHSWSFLAPFLEPGHKDLDWVGVSGALRWMSRYDSQIVGHLEIRKGKVLSGCPWFLSGGSDRARELVAENLKNLGLNGGLGKIWSGVPFGVSLNEINWVKQGGYWVIEGLSDVPFENIRFDGDFNPLILADDYTQLWLPSYKRKYVLFQHNADALNPYGLPLLASAYWIQKAKKAGLRLWVKLMDRFSVPELLAICESSANATILDSQLRDVTASLLALRDGGGGAVANVKEIKELTVSGQGEDFEKFFKFLKDEISLAILGSNLTTSEGSAGSRALGEVHADTSEALFRADAMEIAAVLNKQIIRYIVDLNFGTEETAPVFGWDFEESATWQQVLDAIDRGIPISKSGLYDRFRLPKPVSAADSFVSEKSGKANPAGGAVLSDRPFPTGKTCSCSLPVTKNLKKKESGGWIGPLIG